MKEVAQQIRSALAQIGYNGRAVSVSCWRAHVIRVACKKPSVSRSAVLDAVAGVYQAVRHDNLLVQCDGHWLPNAQEKS